MNRLNKLRMARVFFEFLPQPRNVNINRSRRRHRIVAPNCIEKVVAGVNNAAIFDQILQQLKFHRGEINRRSLFFDLSAFEIDGHITKTKTYY